MKDGTVYKGKILIDTDKAVLIGNPPYSPTSYMLQADDIAKIIYEEYHPEPPSQRKRGFTLETRLSGNVFSSDQLSLGPAAGIYFGAGFRVHPAWEINGGIHWIPNTSAGTPFSVSDGTTTRRYEDFGAYSGEISTRVYPFFQKNWKTEPYLTAGYSWSRLFPKASGDSLKGSGWQVGFGALRPLTTHWFLEGRFVYQTNNFGSIDFLGQDGSISPAVDVKTYSFSGGVSYRF